MPSQETFLDTTIGGRRVQVIKTYDQAYARAVFGEMSDEAKAYLWSSLKPEEIYDPAGLPTETGSDYDAFLLDELLDQGREDWNTFSYFLVLDTRNGRDDATFVSPDWPTAEAFANAEPSASAESLGSRPTPK